MQQDWNAMLQNVADNNQKVVAAAVEFNKIATRTQGLLARRQFAAIETCLDSGTRHLEVAVQTQDPAQALKQHVEIVVELGEKLVAAAQQTLEVQVQARDAIGRWMEDTMNGVKVEAAQTAGATQRKLPRSAKKAA